MTEECAIPCCEEKVSPPTVLEAGFRGDPFSGRRSTPVDAAVDRGGVRTYNSEYNEMTFRGSSR